MRAQTFAHHKSHTLGDTEIAVGALGFKISASAAGKVNITDRGGTAFDFYFTVGTHNYELSDVKKIKLAASGAATVESCALVYPGTHPRI